MGADVSLENFHDAEVLTTLLNPMCRALCTIYSDGAYLRLPLIDNPQKRDGLHSPAQERCVMGKGTPPQRGCAGHAQEELPHWKRVPGYHLRSLAETAMYRFKQLMAGEIIQRNYNGKAGEIMAYVYTMNRLNTLGLPV